MSTGSRKRKLDESAPSKYYAVKAGHKPGVYRSWADCQKNTTGFQGAMYKSFTSEQDAKDFCAGRIVTSSSASAKSQAPRFYGLACVKNPGVYTDWGQAQEQIKGATKPKYKKFPTREEAEAFVKNGGKVVPKTTSEAETSEPSSKKAKRSTDTKTMGKIFKVYTDGSALGNGKNGAIAGVGVYFGNNDARNISEPLSGPLQTNQRAELTAILRALEVFPTDRDIQIISDSSYSINCATVWYKKWEDNNWKSSTGEPVKNKDLVASIRQLIRERDVKGVRTEFEWVKGHADDPSNAAADQLAVAGANAAKASRR